MTNIQTAAGFMMASRARMDLLETRFQLERIASDLHWKQQKEADEQAARNALFRVKKQLLAIGEALSDERAILALVELKDYWFTCKRLTENDFSSFADKEYFDATAQMPRELLQHAAVSLGQRQVKDIEMYYFVQTYTVDNACFLYFLLRARELREADEKQLNLVGQMFYSVTKDKAKPAIESVAHLFRQTPQLDKFRDKVSSTMISHWVSEAMKHREDKFSTSLECLAHMKEMADTLERIGRETGFDAHNAFFAAVYEELRERGSSIPSGPPKVSALPAPQRSPSRCSQFQSLQADPSLLTNIMLTNAEEEFGPCNAEEVWDLYLGGRVHLLNVYWTEGMPEWRPLEEYFDHILATNIWLVDGEQRTGPIHAATVWDKFICSEVRLEFHYWTEGMPNYRPLQEFIDKL